MDTAEAVLAAQSDLAAIPARNVEAVRRIRKKISKRIKPLPASVAKEVGLAVCRVGPKWVGYELIAEHEGALAELSAEEIEMLGDGMSSWDEVDAFAVLLAGAAWRAGVISDRCVKRWAKSESVWWRRAALASTVVLNTKTRGGDGDARRTLMICELVVTDREDMVVKAMSWALRSLADWDADAVAKFLDRYDDRLAARIKREVKSKLTTGLKAPRPKAAE